MQWERTSVAGSFVVHARRFEDGRGYFEEMYNERTFSVLNHDFRFSQLSKSCSRADVLRGLHCSPYGKLVHCGAGAIYDVTVDLRPESVTYLKWFGVWLSEENKKQVYIPPFCAHGFFSKADNSITVYFQEGIYEACKDVDINLFDVDIGIEWPEPTHKYIISEKDQHAPTLKSLHEKLTRPRLPVSVLCHTDMPAAGSSLHYHAFKFSKHVSTDFVLYGRSGYFGGHIANCLDAMGFRWEAGCSRLENFNLIESELDRLRPNFVICAAGVAGKPNIDWCESHRPETIQANITGQLNIIQACLKRNIHCTVFGSGGIYTQNSAVTNGFTEDDQPNFMGTFYARLRITLEELLKSYPNVLNLRVLYPLSDDLHPRSVLGKLVNYPKIISIPTSYTVLDDLFPLIPLMAKQGIVGTFNFCNPGVLNNQRLLELYKEFVDENHTWSRTDHQLEATAVPRPYAELNVAKLLRHFPEVPPIEVAVVKLLQRYRAHCDK